MIVISLIIVLSMKSESLVMVSHNKSYAADN